MKCNDYSMSPTVASCLEGAALLPRELRVVCAQMALATSGADAANIIADLIGMANSVIENARSMLETEAIIRGLVDPHDANKINLPTMAGALMGVSLAAEIDQSRVCATCAFRLGSTANQCPPTQWDARDSVAGEYKFMCHEDLNEDGSGKHGCRGYALAVAARKRA